MSDVTPLTLPPTTGLVMQRLGVDAHLFTVRQSTHVDFPTKATSADEWDAGFKGSKGMMGVEVKVGDVVGYAENDGKKRKRGRGEWGASASGGLLLGLVREICWPDDATTNRDTSSSPSYSIEKLGRLTEVLGPGARRNDLYSTGKMQNVEHGMIRTKLVASTYRLQVKHDEVHAAWVASTSQGQKRDCKKGDLFVKSSSTWLHDNLKLHEGDCLRMRKVHGGDEVTDHIAQITKLEVSDTGHFFAHLTLLIEHQGSGDADSQHQDSHPLLVQLQPGRQSVYDPQRWTIIDKTPVWTSKAEAVGWIKERPFLDESDVFFVVDKEGFKSCETCQASLRQETKEIRQALQGRLRAMSLFSGAGGEVAGFLMDGFIEPTCAIDLDPLCGLTTKTISPDINTIAADLTFLVHSILTSGPLPPTLPTPGTIEIMTISPPCQGFSKANYHRSGSDPRNLLVAVALAMVELYLPPYVVLENVLGMLEPGMKMGQEGQGAVKLILITLVELGYSVSMQTIQAASYGCPSHRHRVIFLASRDGRPLPRLPSYTHAHERGNNTHVNLFPRPGVTRTYTQPTGEPRRWKLLPALTLWDAISDLPAWDWRDPHDLYIDSDKPIDVLKRRRAVEDRIPAYEVGTGSRSDSGWRSKALGPTRTGYRRPATNSYQALMRRSATTTTTQHQTARPGIQQAERVTNVPFRAGASAHDFSGFEVRKPLLWDGVLRSLRTSMATTDGDWRDVSRRAYQRMDAYQPCGTIMTDMNLGGRWGSWVHPRDARVLSVRELARAQSFADHVVFGGRAYGEQEGMSPSEAYKQIGNAVPPLVARAVGRAIAKSHVEWVRDDAARW